MHIDDIAALDDEDWDLKNIGKPRRWYPQILFEKDLLYEYVQSIEQHKYLGEINLVFRADVS